MSRQSGRSHGAPLAAPGEGEPVAAGDSLGEIITAKVTFEYEVQQPGVLRKNYCPAGSITFSSGPEAVAELSVEY